MGRRFALGDEFNFRTEPFEEDLERNYRAVREARMQADVVVVAFHGQGVRRRVTEEHSRIFAHGAIDAGADVYLDHGGVYTGYELYNGKPILYGIGTFMLQNEQVQQVPYDMMKRWGLSYEQGAADFVAARQTGEGQAGGPVVGMKAQDVKALFSGGPLPVVVFDENKQFKEVRVHVVMPLEAPRTQRGRPGLAEPGSEAAKAVLDRIVQTSKSQYGTTVEVVDGVGLLRP
jgi:poly-gamma-glutamate synthesis protein (capsule biosynthesis protein)